MTTCRSGTDCLWVRVRTTRQGYLSVGTLEGVSILSTGQYRDTELANSALPSGLDYFMARQIVSGMGGVAAGSSGTLRSRPRQSAELASLRLLLE